MFIIYPTNIDHLIQYVRLRMGDIDGSRFSDSLIRTSLVSSVKGLQKRWNNRYMVFSPSIVVDPLPDGYVNAVDALTDVNYIHVVPSGYILCNTPAGLIDVPDGLNENDVFRNPLDDSFISIHPVISQDDEAPVIISASLVLRTSQLTSSADTFQSWSDGEYSFSNLGKSRALTDMRNADAAELELYFKKKLSKPMRSDFLDQT